MDAGKIYHDSEGNERTIWQMIKHEPVWAATRVQEGENAIERVKQLEKRVQDLESTLAETASKLVKFAKDNIYA